MLPAFSFGGICAYTITFSTIINYTNLIRNVLKQLNYPTRKPIRVSL